MDEKIKYEITVNSDKPEIVETIPGWSHSITNIGKEELIVMLCLMKTLIQKNQTHIHLKYDKKYKKIKIVSIVGTRPEIIRLSRIFSILDKYCEHILIHTGQNYDFELNQIFFNDLKIRRPDFFKFCK